MAQAVVAELQLNGLFKEVFYTQREKEPNVDLYLTGEIINTSYHGKIFSYGVIKLRVNGVKS